MFPLGGRPLLAYVADALRPQVERLVVSGRHWGALPMLVDRPAPGLGPLGGLAAALHHAQQHRFDAVLTATCDAIGLPADLAHRLGHPTTVVRDHWLIGLWDPGLGPSLDAWLARGGDRAVRHWLGALDIRTIALGGIANLNCASDLPQNGSSYF